MRDGVRLYLLGSAAVAILIVMILAARPEACAETLREWDQFQTVLMDCREDPDCYLAPADIERLRAMAPRVSECER
jgi:hypothetical protein